MPGNTYPEGLKPGDFIQTTSHFSDIYFEVKSCYGPTDGSPYWYITYFTYRKYGSQPYVEWVNSASSIRSVIRAEMVEAVMRFKGLRWQSARGQYDACYGYAPVGTQLRKYEDWSIPAVARG